MIVGTVNRCAKHARFGRIAIDETLSQPLLEQLPDHLAIEPAVEPGDEAAHLGAVDRRAGYHRRAVDRLLEIFADGVGIDENRALGILDQHGRLAGRIHVNELVPLQPGRFPDELMRDRSEERRVGKECGSTGRSRWAAYTAKKNKE